MWDYTDKVLEFFYNPKNQGVLEDKGETGVKVAVGEVGSIACGDALRLHIKVQEDTNKILDARFQTFGCTSAIASSEALVELVKGKTIEEALKISNKEIAEYLGGLPQEKMHCSVMGQEALEAAISNYRGIPLAAHDDDDEGAIICTCFGITEPKIRRIIKDNKLTTAEEVTNFIKAGGGCGTCLATIDDIIIENQRNSTFTPKATSNNGKNGFVSDKPLTPVQKIALIQKILDEEIRPILIADGGDVELYDVDGDRIRVILQGACGSCSSSLATLNNAIEAKLKERISHNISVEAVNN
ncbi:Fe-S cluster assembly protein NifU [Plectonema cf. radiosum LEGE 06105]|uniref:Nitrogen fixation protein NifU n=1 Tax=Plectonema cf. radiosum LEGE 06105 TaxID=945769 RepID=A0A8J7FB60_9CYAN|nr:Fe-S cluster assembly protein NifU [Plectonema radiosum]MBE9212933.1 Fe-S cluster assembly protein NifU [Plectonema cf. radiosum LEGE 06105]